MRHTSTIKPITRATLDLWMSAPTQKEAKADGRAKLTPRIGQIAESARNIAAELLAQREADFFECDLREEYLGGRIAEYDARLAMLKSRPTLVVFVGLISLALAFFVDVELVAATINLLVAEDATHIVRAIAAAGLCVALALAYKSSPQATEKLSRYLPLLAATTAIPLAIHRWSVAREQAAWQASESELPFSAHAAGSPVVSMTLMFLMAVLSLIVALAVAKYAMAVLEGLEYLRLRRRKGTLLAALLAVSIDRVRAAAALQAAREAFDATKLELQAQYMSAYERGQRENRDLSSIWRFALATGLAVVAGAIVYHVGLAHVAEMPARLLAAGAAIITFATTMLVRRRPLAAAMARAGAAAILVAAAAVGQTVVIVSDHSGSMSQISSEAWMQAYGSAAARLPQGGSLSIIPVVGSIEQVAIEKLPRFERQKQSFLESLGRREPYRESLLAFKKSIEAAMPTWVANGGGSDYQGALRVAADRMQVSHASPKIVVVLGDLDDGQLRGSRRTEAFSLPPLSLVGVRVYLGNTINSNSTTTTEASWRQIDAKIDFWQRILKRAGAAEVVAVRSNGIGEFAGWIAGELGLEQAEFQPFRSWFFQRKAATK